MKRFVSWLAAAAFPLILLSPPTASAANLFLNIDGIKGESTDSRHRDWIDILSYSFGVTSSGTTSTGGGGGSGKASFLDFTFTKEVDASSPHLFLAVAKGNHISKAMLDVVDPAAKAGDVYLKYTLDDVMVTSFYQSSGGDRPVESFSLNFAKISMEYRPQDDKGALGSPIRVSWNVATASPAPEPSTWALLIAGLAFVAWRGRRRVQVRAA